MCLLRRTKWILKYDQDKTYLEKATTGLSLEKKKNFFLNFFNVIRIIHVTK